MKKLQLKALELGATGALSRNQMGKIMGAGPGIGHLPVCDGCCPTRPCVFPAGMLCPAVVCPQTA
ncbi:hypothetical protein [Mucilaginibacter sp. SG564]|uniref:hypothetical protein n=1 Tax=unclassified Mucilaginibacter TaxID=2617802 RepID=UPI001555FD93|nr:hypothetical protein [Mucilaginibacter sp. SG564]NOW99112.1 hypothetical protein [Mucilaginibacter sp. SG564]